jgi:PelA/Pel-15E family pectate lyase
MRFKSLFKMTWGPSLIVLILMAAKTTLSGSGGVPFTGADLRHKDEIWIRSDEGRSILGNILSFQTPAGGWCKAYDAHQPRVEGGNSASFGGWNGTPTIDNNATWGEIRLLARAYLVTNRPEYATAALAGIEFLLTRQYPDGGWPQRSPLEAGHHQYGIHITFNDGAMTEVMRLMGDVAAGRGEFTWIPPNQRSKAKVAFDRGIDCILKCQITVDGHLTAWCQQYDETTLAPAGARAYELPSISGAESAGIVLLLMGLPDPDERVRKAISGACAWYTNAEIHGKRVESRPVPSSPKGYDKVLVDDPTAPPIWARYYDLDSGEPFFCDRDGIKHKTLAEISYERRNGYAWYGNWGEKVLEQYPKWLKQQNVNPPATHAIQP